MPSFLLSDGGAEMFIHLHISFGKKLPQILAAMLYYKLAGDSDLRFIPAIIAQSKPIKTGKNVI